MNDDHDLKQTESANLTPGVARRSLLGGLAAGLLAAAGLELAEARKGGKGKGRGKGKGKGKGGGQGQGQTKIQICHKSGKKFTLISVSESARAAHEAHGDVICAVDVCQTGEASGCAEDGACIFIPAEDGTVCTIDGVESTCLAGVCQPVP